MRRIAHECHGIVSHQAAHPFGCLQRVHLDVGEDVDNAVDNRIPTLVFASVIGPLAIRIRRKAASPTHGETLS
jgi:hypothetical protein